MNAISDSVELFLFFLLVLWCPWITWYAYHQQWKRREQARLARLAYAGSDTLSENRVSPYSRSRDPHHRRRRRRRISRHRERDIGV